MPKRSIVVLPREKFIVVRDRMRGEDRERMTDGLELGCLHSEHPIR